MRGTSRDIRNGERGAAYVEFLIAFMPVFTFFAGIVQYALMSTAQVFVDHAATVAARTAALALGRPGATENSGQQDTPVRLGTEREGLVRKAVVLTLAPLVLDGTALEVNVDYPRTADANAVDDPSQTFAAMTYTSTPYVRTRVQMRMACLIPVANRLMCGIGLAGGLLDPTKWLEAESVFPVERAKYQPKQGCEPPLTGQGVATNTPTDGPIGRNGPTGPYPQNGPGSPYDGWVCDRNGYCHPGSGQCFVAGTPVLTPDGERPIESLVVGDTVETVDPEAGTIGAYPVVQTTVRTASSLVDITLVDARGRRDTIRGTDGHPFWTLDRGWVSASDLRLEETLTGFEGIEERVASLTWVPIEALVYNLEVEHAHTYLVGATHTLVHNQPTACTNPAAHGNPCNNPGCQGFGQGVINFNPPPPPNIPPLGPGGVNWYHQPPAPPVATWSTLPGPNQPHRPPWNSQQYGYPTFVHDLEAQAIANAPPGTPLGMFQCPYNSHVNCPGNLPSMNPNNFQGFAIDHVGATWAQRIRYAQAMEQAHGRCYTEQQISDIYHASVRPACGSCNSSGVHEPSNAQSQNWLQNNIPDPAGPAGPPCAVSAYYHN